MATVTELRGQLAELGVEVPKKATKAELEKVLANASVETTVDLSEPAPAPREPVPKARKGELELVGNLLHNGRLVEAGAAAPQDLSDAQVERLERLGVLAPAK